MIDTVEILKDLHQRLVLNYNDGVPFEQLEEDRLAVLNALEKQIPKKPNIHGYREGREINTISYTCPICNEHIGRESFCKHCGQALDWSDAE